MQKTREIQVIFWEHFVNHKNKQSKNSLPVDVFENILSGHMKFEEKKPPKKKRADRAKAPVNPPRNVHIPQKQR